MGSRLAAEGSTAVRAYSIGLYEKAMPGSFTWEEKLRCAKECHYDFLEMSVDETEEKLARLSWTAQERQALVRTMFDAGLPIRSMCLSAHRRFPLGAKSEEARARALQIMEQAIALSEDLGIRTIQLAGYDAYYEADAWEKSEYYFAKNLEKAVNRAAAAGVSLGFETMETPFMNTVWKSMFYVQQRKSPWLGVYPDCGNLTNAALAAGPCVQDDLSAGQGHLIAMHLKPTKPGVFRDMLFDDATAQVDFEGDIARAWALGVRRYVTEMWYQGADAWREDIRTANTSMRRLLDEQAAKTDDSLA